MNPYQYDNGDVTANAQISWLFLPLLVWSIVWSFFVTHYFSEAIDLRLFFHSGWSS